LICQTKIDFSLKHGLTFEYQTITNMKTILKLSISLFLCASCVNAQILKKTYYDFQKTKVNEVYYVNAKGEKNGLYKTYDEATGVLTEEATFVNGELNGVHKLYNWTTGKAILRQSETYKNNVKTGEAKYYDGESSMILNARGNLIAGKKNGIWTFITKLEVDNLPEGCKFIKTTMEYKDDEAIKEGDIAYYYPSNKLFYKTEGNTTTGYFPEGKVSTVTITDASGQTISEMVYDREGKIVSEKHK
jgi:antitoxin component YwqK of YwqJK toxin-antitoxin module